MTGFALSAISWIQSGSMKWKSNKSYSVSEIEIEVSSSLCMDLNHRVVNGSLLTRSVCLSVSPFGAQDRCCYKDVEWIWPKPGNKQFFRKCDTWLWHKTSVTPITHSYRISGEDVPRCVACDYGCYVSTLQI